MLFFLVNDLFVRFISKEQTQVDVEDYEEFPDGHYGKFK